MPTSYEAYAVDLNENGRRDLVGEVADAIGSVGNYLAKRGWRRGQAIFADLPDGIPEAAESLVNKRSKPATAIADLTAAGVVFDATNTGEKAALLRLEEARGTRYFVAFHNFHVITTYNPSVNYAMAVSELAGEIEAARVGR